MKTNVGTFDVAVRFLIGWSFLFLISHGLGWWGLLGLWPLLTGVCEFCPLYALFHINTATWEAGYEERHRKHDLLLKK